MHGQYSDIHFQIIEVSVRLAAVHGEAHFVTARMNPYTVGAFCARPPKSGRKQLTCDHAPAPRDSESLTASSRSPRIPPGSHPLPISPAPREADGPLEEASSGFIPVELTRRDETALHRALVGDDRPPYGVRGGSDPCARGAHRRGKPSALHPHRRPAGALRLCRGARVLAVRGARSAGALRGSIRWARPVVPGIRSGNRPL